MKITEVAVLLCLAIAASAVSFSRVIHEEWEAFKLEHQKWYKTELEDQYHMKIYMMNKHKIAKHNQLFARGLVSFSQKLNKYSDMPHDQFVNIMSGFIGNSTEAQEDQDGQGSLYIPPANWLLPKSVDWRKLGAVTEVKDQGLCRSCWAFSATGALEGQNYRRNRRLVSLSEQNLIDCTRNKMYGNYGCEGGKMTNAFKYINDNRGIDTERSYPYEAMDDSCRYNAKDSGAIDVGYVSISRCNTTDLMKAVASAGPVAAAIDGTLESFRHYSGGVFYDKNCKASHWPKHAVLIVGYGTEKTGKPYWLIKNSWGLTWGMKGYGKIARTSRNFCGIACDASFPSV